MAFDRSNIEVEDYLECLEMRNVSRATEEEWRFSCPYPSHLNGDENASAYMNDRTSAFYCHGCKNKGDGVSFAAYVLGISHLEAVRMLRQRYQPGFIDPSARNMLEEVRKILDAQEEEPDANTEFDDSLIESLAVDWEKVSKFPAFAPEPFRYMIERGFTAETLNSWDFGYHERTDRVTFGVRNEQGSLVGVKGRAWEKGREPKYLVLGDVPTKPQRYGFPRYQTGLLCFGLDRARQHNRVIICEGELNAIALHQCGYTNAVAVNGSNFTESQKKLITRHFDHATVFFDLDDNAGWDGTFGHFNDAGKWVPGIVDKLKDFISVSVVPPTDGDPADMVQDGRIDDLREAIESAESATAIRVAQLLEA
jgi:DNA primase